MKTTRITLWRILLAIALTALLLAACADSGDDDDDDDDDQDDDIDDDDDDDYSAPQISELITYPEQVPQGGALNFVIHFVDPDADLIGGSIHAAVDTVEREPVTIIHEERGEGELMSNVLPAEDAQPGEHLLAVWIVDAAGNQSNVLEATFEVAPANRTPSISNLRFDPNPVCNLVGSTSTMLVDFADLDGNLGGGMILVIIDEGSINPFIISPDLEQTEGTLELEVTLTETAPAESSSQFSVQVADALGAVSNQLEAELLMRATACE
ncbi:MAG: hypothetical protein P9M14_01715 [Candidatus Alcyoniella australis]|nr:hypothetical protein [Candidatus Alcyoniella australis]